MDEVNVRINAYYGEPRIVGGLHVRKSISYLVPLMKNEVINDPDMCPLFRPVDVSAGAQAESSYTLDCLIDDFENQHICKVNIEEPVVGSAQLNVHEFDVFEPSFNDREEAINVIDDLTDRICDWINGHPKGKPTTQLKVV